MWKNYLFLFLSSACVMTLELVAGRLIAPYLGVSLYTWTGVIGACLSGMSFGSLFGGWLADHREPQRWLPRLFLISAAVMSGLLLLQPLMPFAASALPRLHIPPVIGIFVLSLILFGLPCFFISSISPLVYKMALTEANQAVGSVIGRLSAMGIAGSLTGTYVTGFFLIPSFGTRTIVTGTAIGLGALGAMAISWRRRLQVGTTLAVIGLPLLLPTAFPALRQKTCDVESAYYCIRVATEERGGELGPVKLMRLDYLVHSGYRVKAPEDLWYNYEKVIGWLVQARGQQRLRTLFLGGGGYILPNWIEKQYPKASVDVVEIDPAVTTVALGQLVPGAHRITSHNTDARFALSQFPAKRTFDIVVGDVFNDLSVPYHLTTREFARVVKSHLDFDGLYLLNVVDQAYGGPFLGAITATLKTEFPYVYTLPGGAGLVRGEGRSPHVVVAGFKPVPWADWLEHPSKPLFDVKPFNLHEEPLVLTDDFAPTDQLLLPVFADRWRAQ